MGKLSSRLTPINDLYPTCERTECTLAIYGLDPEVVIQHLGLAPTNSQKKGVPKVMPNGNIHMPTISNWLLSSEDQVTSKDIRRHLDWLLDRIEPVSKQLLELQQLPDATMAIRCVWWSADGGGGPTFWPEQMLRIAKLNLELTISFAYYENKENED